MGFDFAIVKNPFTILKFHGIAELAATGENLTDFLFFRRCEIFGVGSRVGQKTALVEALHDLQALFHGHFILFAEKVLQFGKRIEFSRKQRFFFAFDRGYHRAGRVIKLATLLYLGKLIFFKFVFGNKLDLFPVGLFAADHGVVNVRDKIANGKITIVNCLYNGNNHAADAQKPPGANGCVARQIHAVKPVDKSAGISFRGQKIVFAFVFQIPQSGGNRLRRLIGQPEAFERLRRFQGVLNAQSHDNFALAIRVSRVDNGIHVRAVAKRRNDAELLDGSGVGLLVFAFAEFKTELLGKTGQIPHGPTCRSIRLRIIGFNIAKREKVAERPRNQIPLSF